ncbi:MAG: hypothetical protein P1U74_05795 [Legionellaceae bacterium]|nr:hypothetical protein [Legionellaceae bacterium]
MKNTGNKVSTIEEETGIRVTPGDAVPTTEDRTDIRVTPIVNIDSDEEYYAAHPPASSLITLSFMNGQMANATPRNPRNWQMVVRNEEDQQKEEESNKGCTIS